MSDCDGKEHKHEDHTDHLGPLPKNVKKRVCALKNIQLRSIEVEAQFYEKVHALEREFEALFQPIFEERRQVVTGEKEPTDAEADIPLLHNVDKEVIESIYSTSLPDTEEKGIKDFWLTVLRASEMTTEMIQEHDVPILSHLIDIKTTTLLDPPRFTLEFHFSDNEYFKNKVLTKEYFLELKPDGEHTFEYDGPHVSRVTGMEINWEDGKNVTKKAVKKKQKKGANAGKFLTKVVKADSFFNFFDPPKSADERNEDDDEEDSADDLLHMDYEIGQTIRDAIIPRAVLFYTGEIESEDLFNFQGEDEDDFSDDDDQ